MSRVIPVFAVLLLLACAIPPPEDPTLATLPIVRLPVEEPEGAAVAPLAVPDAVVLALKNNPGLAAAAARIAAADEAIRAVAASYLPRLGLSGGYAHTTDPVQVFMMQLRQRELRMTGDFNHPGAHGNARASVEASWLLFDGGRRSAGERMAQLNSLVEQGERAAIANELKAAVISTCLAVYEAREFSKVADKSVALVSEQLRIAESRFEAGSAQRSDVLSVEVRLAEAREEVVRARNAGERALTALRGLLGMRAVEPLVLADDPGFRVPPVLGENRIETALSSRPEVGRGMRGVEMALAGVNLKEADRRLMLSVYGSWDFDERDGTFGGNRESRTGGFRVDLPVFEGGRTDAEVAVAKARVREAKELLRSVVLMVESDVRRAELDLAEAEERVRVSEKSEERAEEALSMIRARYESGAATITEYLDAETALTGARVRGVASRYQVERATADLRRAMGICRAGTEDAEGGA
ncbi:MAG: TolC family protein [Planctomycetes bacterium]|jgi:outer membrane protein TolC|nr:TolC family protein [Planctomycetota bacterium]